jgi:ATP-binding cassette subfamily B (MDR/TAP) protein 1
MASQPSKASLESLDSLHDIYSTMPSTTSIRQRSVLELPDLKDLEPIDNLNGKPSWRSLFNFTTRQHVFQLLLTIVFTILSSLLQPTGAVFYVKVFAVLTSFGSGTLNAHDTLQEIAKWCTALVILGIVSWFVEVGFLSLWMTFGELQAKSVREQMFTNMLGKDMDWYDMRQYGIGSLLVRIET